MITVKEIRFCIKVVVTGKGNLETVCQHIMASHSASTKVEAHLYVPASTSKSVSRSGLGRKRGVLHERMNLLTTSKAESALTAAMAKRPWKICRSIKFVHSDLSSHLIYSQTATSNHFH